MAQLLTGRDNEVQITFGGVDLTLFTNIEVALGSDVRTSELNPESVIIENETTLSLNFGDTTETGSHYFNIVAFDAVNTDGIELTSQRIKNLPSIQII